MFRGVLQHPLSHVVILDAVNGRGLEPPPAEGDNERVTCLEDAFVPAMFLQPHSDKAEAPLPWQDSTHYHWVVGVKVLHKFTRHSCKIKLIQVKVLLHNRIVWLFKYS